MVIEHRLRMLAVGTVALLAALAFAFAISTSAYGADAPDDQDSSFVLQEETATEEPMDDEATEEPMDDEDDEATEEPMDDEEDDGTPEPGDTGNAGLVGQSNMALGLGVLGLAIVAGFAATGRFVTRQR